MLNIVHARHCATSTQTEAKQHELSTTFFIIEVHRGLQMHNVLQVSLSAGTIYGSYKRRGTYATIGTRLSTSVVHVFCTGFLASHTVHFPSLHCQPCVKPVPYYLGIGTGRAVILILLPNMGLWPTFIGQKSWGQSNVPTVKQCTIVTSGIEFHKHTV